MIFARSQLEDENFLDAQEYVHSALKHLKEMKKHSNSEEKSNEVEALIVQGK